MSHPRAEAFWQIPHRRDRQDNKCPTNARGRMSRLGIDWVIKEWNAWRNHDRITRTTVLIYIFLLLLKFKDRHFYDTITSTTVLIHFFCYYWSSRTVILILKKINLKVLYSVQLRNTEKRYPKINWNAGFFLEFFTSIHARREWIDHSRPFKFLRKFLFAGCRRIGCC